MTILDRYLAIFFFRTLAICYVSLVGLFIVIDLFNSLDDFLLIADQEGGLWRVLAEYYGARLLMFFDRTSGVLAMLATVFTLTSLQRANECTAMLAAGIPPRRLAAPLALAAACVAALAAANRETLTPRFQDQLSRAAKNWLGNKPRPISARYDHATDIFLGGQHAVPRERLIVEPKFGLPEEFSMLGSQLSAGEAVWEPARDARPAGYRLRDVRRPEDISERPSVWLGERLVVLTPYDTPWLAQDECFVASDVQYEHLLGGNSWQQHASTRQLIDALRNPSLDMSAATRVATHGRLVQPLLDMVLVLLGLPLGLSHDRRKVFVVAGASLALVGGFQAVVLCCHSLGGNGLLAPDLAAWCPLLILAPAAVFWTGKAS